MVEPTRKEMEQLLEKAKREYEAIREKMTPEEREQADIKAQKMIEEDQARIQEILDSAARITAQTAPKTLPKFCGNCGAPVSGGTICEYCGLPY